jgi:hypothetical protein
MNPADEEAAKLVPTEGQSPGAVAASDDQFEEQLRATLRDIQRTNHQSRPVEDLHGSDDKFAGVRKAVGIRRGAISGSMKVSFQAARSIG